MSSTGRSKFSKLERGDELVDLWRMLFRNRLWKCYSSNGLWACEGCSSRKRGSKHFGANSSHNGKGHQHHHRSLSGV